MRAVSSEQRGGNVADGLLRVRTCQTTDGIVE